MRRTFSTSPNQNTQTCSAVHRQSSVTIAAKFFLSIVLAFLSVALSGCLIYETIEYRLKLNSDGKSGSLWIEYTNIESSAVDTAKQREDFYELIDKWKGDKYLLERMNDGVYIKQRSLRLNRGILIWKESGIFSDIRNMKDGVQYEDTTRITISKDQAVLSTNGTVIVTRDSTVVSWPPHTKDFRLRIQQRDFNPTSHFAKKFSSLRTR